MEQTTDRETLFQLLAALINGVSRQQAARRLAQYLGAQDLLIFLLNETGTLQPAPGFVQTLPDRQLWQTFLASCAEGDPVWDTLPFPDPATMTTAVGFAGENGIVLVLLGGTPQITETQVLLALLPLVGAAFQHEQARQLAEAEAESARAHAAQTETLLTMLGDARQEVHNELHERVRAETALHEQIRLAALQMEVSTALTATWTLRESLEQCAGALVRHLGAAFARIWTLNEAEQVLELRASAGMYTHLGGGHARIPVGSLKIGLIAEERRPHLTNAVVGDQRISDQEWARREGMVAFAGYPLLVGDRLVGVMALFARHRITQAVLDSMASVANAIALGIEHHRAEEAIHQNLVLLHQERERLGVALVASRTGTFRWDPFTEVYLEFDESLKRLFGIAPGEPVRVTQDFLDHVHPDDLPAVLPAVERCRQGADFEMEYRVIHPDRSIHWLYARAKMEHDEQGNPTYLVGACTDVTDQKDLERQKEVLMSMATHELRTPLTSLQGYIQLAERRLRRLQNTLSTGQAGPQQLLNEVFAMLSRSQQQLSIQNRLVTDLLDVSRMQENALELCITSCDLVRLVRETVQDCQAAYPQRQIVLALPEQGTLVVQVDHDRIVQVLNNYLSNALKYSAASKMIQVGLTRERNLVRVWVADQGPGLSFEAQQRIWEQFYRAPDIAIQNRMGVSLGLGLPICRGIISGHAGKVGVESTPGQGSRFWFILPLSASPGNIHT